MVYLDNHIITLNSTDGTLLNGTYKSNMNFAFRGLLKDDINIIRTYVTVLNAQIPVSFYVIDTTNNVLVVQKVAGSKVLVTIPVGNYNSATLITSFATACASAGVADITMSINTLNGILGFSSSTYSYTLFSLSDSRSTIATIFGINSNIFLNAGSTSTNAQYPLNLLGKSKLLINSRNLNNVAYTSYGLGFSTTIATIPVNVPPYSLIQYACAVEQQKNILVNRVLDNIDIQILDTNNNFINFNNIDWSLTLVLSIERIDANKFHIQNFQNYLEEQPIQPEEIELNPPEQDKDLEFLQSLN